MTTQRLRCSVCGDTMALAGDPHECWVWTKLQEPAVHEICTRCGEVEANGWRHWRCWEKTPDGQ